jgi:hypothetical protein
LWIERTGENQEMRKKKKVFGKIFVLVQSKNTFAFSFSFGKTWASPVRHVKINITKY